MTPECCCWSHAMANLMLPAVGIWRRSGDSLLWSSSLTCWILAAFWFLRMHSLNPTTRTWAWRTWFGWYDMFTCRWHARRWTGTKLGISTCDCWVEEKFFISWMERWKWFGILRSWAEKDQRRCPSIAPWKLPSKGQADDLAKTCWSWERAVWLWSFSLAWPYGQFVMARSPVVSTPSSEHIDVGWWCIQRVSFYSFWSQSPAEVCEAQQRCRAHLRPTWWFGWLSFSDSLWCLFLQPFRWKLSRWFYDFVGPQENLGDGWRHLPCLGLA